MTLVSSYLDYLMDTKTPRLQIENNLVLAILSFLATVRNGVQVYNKFRAGQSQYRCQVRNTCLYVGLFERVVDSIGLKSLSHNPNAKDAASYLGADTNLWRKMTYHALGYSLIFKVWTTQSFPPLSPSPPLTIRNRLLLIA